MMERGSEVDTINQETSSSGAGGGGDHCGGGDFPATMFCSTVGFMRRVNRGLP